MFLSDWLLTVNCQGSLRTTAQTTAAIVYVCTHLTKPLYWCWQINFTLVFLQSPCSLQPRHYWHLYVFSPLFFLFIYLCVFPCKRLARCRSLSASVCFTRLHLFLMPFLLIVPVQTCGTWAEPTTQDQTYTQLRRHIYVLVPKVSVKSDHIWRLVFFWSYSASECRSLVQLGDGVVCVANSDVFLVLFRTWIEALAKAYQVVFVTLFFQT